MTYAPHILLVEDDPEDERFIAAAIESHFGSKPQVLRTEREFAAIVGDLAKAPPDVIVMDLMLRWTFPAADLRIDDLPGPFHTAGLRCIERLRRVDALTAIPVILYTTLAQGDVTTSEVMLTKSDDVEPLMKEIRLRIARRAGGEEPGAETT